jgi:hypothetical protein
LPSCAYKRPEMQTADSTIVKRIVFFILLDFALIKLIVE